LIAIKNLKMEIDIQNLNRNRTIFEINFLAVNKTEIIELDNSESDFNS